MKKIHLATDHAGFEMKEAIKSWLHGNGYDVVDHGAFVYDAADDFPEFIAEAGRALMNNSEESAIIFGGSGQGEAMVANRFPGIRATVYYGGTATQVDADGKEIDIITSSKEHNNANVLSLGARFITTEEAQAVIERWLSTEFSGEERHLRRIAAIDRLTEKYDGSGN